MVNGYEKEGFKSQRKDKDYVQDANITTVKIAKGKSFSVLKIMLVLIGIHSYILAWKAIQSDVKDPCNNTSAPDDRMCCLLPSIT